jgi:moderate conductance mechanosensitive channel
VLAAAVLASSNAGQIAACGPKGDQKWICSQVYNLTGSESAAEVADALAVPLRIALVLLVAWLITWMLSRIVQRTTRRIRDEGSLSVLGQTARIPMSENAQLRRAQRAATVGSVLRNIISIVVWTVAVLVILGEIGVDIGPILAAAGVAGIAIGFGTQTMVRDYLAGLYVVLEDQYGVGDEIEVGEVSGTVEWVTLRMTRVRDADGVAWYLGNGEIRVVGNRSQRKAAAGEPAAPRSDDTTGDDETAGGDGPPDGGGSGEGAR